MVDETPRLGLNTYEPGESGWDHTDAIRAIDEHAVASGSIQERPESGSYDDELYFAADQRILWRWDEAAGDWRAAGGVGTSGEPVPATAHFDGVQTDVVRTTSHPVIDVTHPDYGVEPGGDPSENRAGLQRALEDAFEARDVAKVELPAGTVRIDEPIGFSRSEDTRCRINLVGQGRRETVLRQTADAPIVELRTTDGNVRDFNVRNLKLAGGTYGFDLAKAYYNEFRNLSFQSQGPGPEGAAINWRYGGVSLTSVTNCWFVHTGHVLSGGTSGGVNFENCLFGEDVGRIDVNGGTVDVKDCKFHRGFDDDDHEYGGGMHDMGKAIFDVGRGGRLTVTNCSFNLHRSRLLNANDNRLVKFSDNVVVGGESNANGIEYFRSRSSTYNDSLMSVFVIEDNVFRASETPSIWVEHQSGNAPTKYSTVRNNTFVANAMDVEFTFPDALTNPTYENVVDNHEAHPDRET